MKPLADALLRIKEWNARDDNPDEISGDDLDTVCNALDRTLAAVSVFADPAELMSRLQASGARISHDTACRIIEDDRFGLQAIAMEAQDADLAAHDAQERGLNEANMFWDHDDSEQQYGDPEEIIESRLDWSGDTSCVARLQCAHRLPDIWVAGTMTGDKITYTEHTTEAHARAALTALQSMRDGR